MRLRMKMTIWMKQWNTLTKLPWNALWRPWRTMSLTWITTLVRLAREIEADQVGFCVIAVLGCRCYIVKGQIHIHWYSNLILFDFRKLVYCYVSVIHLYFSEDSIFFLWVLQCLLFRYVALCRNMNRFTADYFCNMHLLCMLRFLLS